MNNPQCLLSAFLAFLSASTSMSQVTMTPLTSFSGDGWLAPLEISWLSDTAATERSIAYSAGPNYLFVSSRAGSVNRIRILDGTTAAEVNAANGGVDMTGVAGGTFSISAVAVAGDGILYGCNLVSPSVSSASPFKIYRWDDIGSAPTVVILNPPVTEPPTPPITGGRMGDTLDATGSGTATLLVAGESNPAGSVGNCNGYAIFKTADGASFTGSLVTFPLPVAGAPNPSPGDFKAGITFSDADSVIGSQGSGGFKFTSFSGTTGTFEQATVLTSSAERPMDFTVLGGKPLLATIETNGNTTTPPDTFSTVRVYDVTNLATPVLAASGRKAEPWRTQGGSGGGTGTVRWGQVTGNSATLYALSTNNGIQAFTVSVIPPPPLEFSTIRLNPDSTINLAWPAAAGATYRLEASGNLVNWTTVVPGISEDGSGTASVLWGIPSEYRIRAQLRVVRE